MRHRSTYHRWHFTFLLGLYATFLFCFKKKTVFNADQAGFELTAVGETNFDVLIPTFASQVLGL